MDSFVVQFLALVLFAACVFYSWNVEGRRMAQQWFLIGYIFALLLISLLVVISQIAYDPAMPVIGAAPSVTIMLFPAVWFLAYRIAGALVDPNNLRAMGYLVFLLTAALLLPIDATAVALGWWSFPSESYSFLDGVPFYLPLAWGVTGAAFYLLVGRVRRIRFRGSGQLFALVIGAPFLVGVTLILIALVQVVVAQVGGLGGAPALYALLGLVFGLLPLGLLWNRPRAPRRVTG